jgi:hypothetical protein
MLKYFKVGLDDDFRERIEHAAKANNRSLGEEIRNRLAASLAYDEKQAKDEQLYKLLGTIEQIADDVRYHCDGAEWHKDPTANKIFSNSVLNLIRSYDPVWGATGANADALIAALMEPEIATSGRVIAKEARRKAGAGIFSLTTRALIRPVGDGDDQTGLPDEAAQVFERAASEAASELRRAGARPRRRGISGEGTPQGKVAKDDPAKEGIAEGRSTKQRRGKRR